ncbi:MAG TPA: non-reducing end alpha-L-arabinofuranosidase family hydrolase [Acidobacteriota bacterium]|nr:non-reducing end alpha-L-arabinofuranosidase family hydrolase [Acidobacteriota bacterium]
METKVPKGCFILYLATLFCSYGLGFQQLHENADMPNIQFSWSTGEPILGPPASDSDLTYSVKEPSLVFFDNRWHLFCSLRGKNDSRKIGYLTFADWPDLGSASSTPLELTSEPFGTPQVFYYSPQKLWYLVYQLHQDEELAVKPVFSTSRNVSSPSGWSPPAALLVQRPKEIKAWADFWIICDEDQAHLFFTSNDGRIWRSETRRNKFPTGWSEPQVAIRGDFIGAPHIYRVRGNPHYLALVEAHRQWRRFYKAYLSPTLQGPWKPLAVTRTRPFASLTNVEFGVDEWTDTFGHGELLRAGHDERLEVELEGMRFLYQGSRYADREGKLPREVPWKLGILVSKRR